MELCLIGTKTSIGAMFEMQSKYGWDLQAPICTAANPTGPVTDEAFETICNYIMQPLHAIQVRDVRLALLIWSQTPSQVNVGTIFLSPMESRQSLMALSYIFMELWSQNHTKMRRVSYCLVFAISSATMSLSSVRTALRLIHHEYLTQLGCPCYSNLRFTWEYH